MQIKKKRWHIKFTFFSFTLAEKKKGIIFAGSKIENHGEVAQLVRAHDS